jgi:hypothetical protein
VGAAVTCPDCGETLADLDSYEDHRFFEHRVMNDQAVREWDEAHGTPAAPADPKPIDPTPIRKALGLKKTEPLPAYVTTAMAAQGLTPTPPATPAPRKEAPMPCSKCNGDGHNARGCPQRLAAEKAAKAAKPCGYCKRTGGHTEKCPRGTANGQVAKPAAAAAVSPNGGAIPGAIAELRKRRLAHHEAIEEIDDLIGRLEKAVAPA